ncbi:MAG: PAS domain S-box protein [Stenomitos rutilans HA7619-LM2]|jgi:PAS domain S-box-containing protein|nr:PAS domain S-box protein [Stenomitos rutilans HA7619-LM2]
MDNPAALPVSSSQLQAIVNRMSLALDAVAEAIAWTNDRGCIQWCNAAFERLTNQTVRALTTQPLPAVLPLTVDGDVLPRSLHPVQLALVTQQPQAGEYACEQHDRTLRLALTVTPLPHCEHDRTPDGVMLVLRDVTPQRQALEAEADRREKEAAAPTVALGETNTWAIPLLESIPDVFYVLDQNWCFTYLNCQTEQLLQRSQTELLGKHIFTCFPEASDPSVHKYPWAVKASSITAFEAFYAPFNTWFEVRAYPVGSALAVYAQNINQRKKAELEHQETETALRESEQWFRSVFNATAVGMVVATSDGSVLQVNAAYSQMLGYTQLELAAKTCQQLVHPDDFASGVEPLKKLLAGELSAYHTERRYFHKQGHVVWGLVSISIVRDGQRPARYVVYQVQDISDRQAALDDRKQAEAALRESETRLKLALEAARMITWDWNPATNEAIYSGGYLNPGFNLPSGVQSYAYEAFMEGVYPDDRAYVQEALACALKGADYNVEFRVLWSDDTQQWVASQGKTYFNELGAPVRMLGVLRDITAYKQSELALQQLNQELEQRVQRRTAQIEQVNQQLQTAIAAHQQTETALRKSEERFRIIFDYAPIAISLSDTHTYQIAKVNRAHHELLGYSKADLETMTHVDMAHPKDADKNVTLIQQLLEGKISRFQMEKRFVKKTGEWIWTNLTVALIRDPDGRAYSMGMLEDITDRKRAEETLRDNQQFLQLVIDSVPNRIFWKDKNLRYLGCNRPFAIDAGLASPQDILGKTDFDLPWAVYAERCQVEDLQVLTSKQPTLDKEVVLLRAGGEHRWIKTSKVPLCDKSESVVGVLGAYEDITLRRKTDQALRLTQFSIDRAVDPIWWVKSNGSIYYVNDAACRDLGYPRDAILRKNVCDLNPDLPYEAWFDHWQMIKAQGSLTFEARVQAQDGTFFPVEVTANYVELNGKEYHCSFVRNITRRKQAEAQLRASLTEKEVLLKEVHHRVKNNLQMVSSLLNLQLDAIQDPKVLAPLQDSQRRIKAMVLVHERLYQSEGLETVNFSDYVHHLVTDLIHSYSIDPDKIRLSLELTQLELPINAAIPCGLVINELVTNALKYAFPCDRTGEIHISFSVPADGQCLLVVADNGVGFLASMASLNHTSDLGSLGLQLVHAFVHQLRGTIDLCCSHGTRFELSFPYPI